MRDTQIPPVHVRPWLKDSRQSYHIPCRPPIETLDILNSDAPMDRGKQLSSCPFPEFYPLGCDYISTTMRHYTPQPWLPLSSIANRISSSVSPASDLERIAGIKDSLKYLSFDLMASLNSSSISGVGAVSSHARIAASVIRLRPSARRDTSRAASATSKMSSRSSRSASAS